MKRMGVWTGFIWSTIRTSDGWDVVHTMMKGEKFIYQPRDQQVFRTNSAPPSELQTYTYLS